MLTNALFYYRRPATSEANECGSSVLPLTAIEGWQFSTAAELSRAEPVSGCPTSRKTKAVWIANFARVKSYTVPWAEIAGG
jgi:hypothetical protein